MPFVLLRNSDGSFKVKNKDTGSVKAKKTTKAKAEAQIRLLELIRRKEKK
jgi:hypothetical protein